MTTIGSQSGGGQWQWENAAAGAIAGFATVAAMHPLDVVRTRFQVNDGRISVLPTYKNTPHALLTIARLEGHGGLYAGFYPAVLGSSISWGLFFFLQVECSMLQQSKAKVFSQHRGAAEPSFPSGSSCRSRRTGGFNSNSRFLSALIRFGSSKQDYIFKLLYFKLVNIQVSHGAIQFSSYEELRRLLVDFKSKRTNRKVAAEVVLNSLDYTFLGGSSKVAAILTTYPFQVIRAWLQQRPNTNGIPRYADSLHVVKETARFEGFYKGITANLMKNVPASALIFVEYENVVIVFKLTRRKD